MVEAKKAIAVARIPNITTESSAARQALTLLTYHLLAGTIYGSLCAFDTCLILMVMHKQSTVSVSFICHFLVFLLDFIYVLFLQYVLFCLSFNAFYHLLDV